MGATAVSVRPRGRRRAPTTARRPAATAEEESFSQAGLSLRAWATVAMVTGVVLVQLWIRMHVIYLGYRLEEARRTHQVLLDRGRELELELAFRNDPERIGERARAELGMRLATPADVVRIEEHGGAR